jgi:hypothetical protein
VHEALQFAQIENDFSPTIANLFKQSHSPKKLVTKMKLDLREIILLDSQSTMDLFCNQNLVGEIFEERGSSMRLKSNGGKMVVDRQAIAPGYHKRVWFSKRAITNIIALKNLIQQYHVTYDSHDVKGPMCVVHREAAGLPNMEFRMHESGLHVYNPR